MAEKKNETASVSEAINKKETVKYTKRQLAVSEKFREKRDIINALFDDGRKYSIEEAEKIIKDFLTRRAE